MSDSRNQSQMWGRFEHIVDEKGRVIVPLRFREALGDEFVLTTGPGKHIRIYTMESWGRLEAELQGASLADELNPDLALLQRIFGSCEYSGTDQQNRVSIPRHLRDWANIREGETAIVLGSGSRLEIWNRLMWETYSEVFTEEDVRAAAARIGADRAGAPAGLATVGAAGPE